MIIMRSDMRDKLTFKSRGSTQNDYGEEVSWSNFNTVWGAVEPILGKEYFAAATVESQVEIKFRCYYFEGVTNQMRVYFNGFDYDILSAINVKSLNREWLVYAKKVIL